MALVSDLIYIHLTLMQTKFSVSDLQAALKLICRACGSDIALSNQIPVLEIKFKTDV